MSRAHSPLSLQQQQNLQKTPLHAMASSQEQHLILRGCSVHLVTICLQALTMEQWEVTTCQEHQGVLTMELDTISLVRVLITTAELLHTIHLDDILAPH